jgi:hypothetical protein
MINQDHSDFMLFAIEQVFLIHIRAIPLLKKEKYPLGVCSTTSLQIKSSLAVII